METTLPPHYYTKSEFFDREVENIFFRSWLYAAHRSQVAQPGDFVTFSILDQNLILMRGQDDVLRGFYNVCPHRAHELLSEASGNRKAIVCPYHAWTYDTSGRLLSARGSEQVEGFQLDRVCISQFKVEEFCGFVFVNLDPEAASMTDTYPGIEAGIRELAPGIDTRVYTYHHSKHLNANWKVAVENYNECYHCPGVHPTFSTGVVDPKSYRITPGTNCLLHTANSQPDGKQAYAIDPSNPNANRYGSFYMWPSFSVQIYPGSVVNSFHWLPQDVGNTVVHRSWFFEGAEPTPAQREIIELDRTTTFAEDLSIIDSVQRGLRSRGYQPGPLILDPSGVATSRSENTAYELKKLVLDAIG